MTAIESDGDGDGERGGDGIKLTSALLYSSTLPSKSRYRSTVSFIFPADAYVASFPFWKQSKAISQSHNVANSMAFLIKPVFRFL